MGCISCYHRSKNLFNRVKEEESWFSEGDKNPCLKNVNAPYPHSTVAHALSPIRKLISLETKVRNGGLDL